jgi:hypothetical protein
LREDSSKLLSKWDLLPLFVLVCIAFLLLQSRFADMPLVNDLWGPGRKFWGPGRSALMGGFVAVGAWGFLTVVMSMMKQDRSAYLAGRTIITTGWALFGLSQCMRPFLSESIATGMGFGIVVFTALISLVTMAVKSQNCEPIEMLENDPIFQDKYWKLGNTVYYNPQDKRLVVPARDTYLDDVGANKMFNFGNKRSWLMFSPCLLPILPTIFRLLF